MPSESLSFRSNPSRPGSDTPVVQTGPHSSKIPHRSIIKEQCRKNIPGEQSNVDRSGAKVKGRNSCCLQRITQTGLVENCGAPDTHSQTSGNEKTCRRSALSSQPGSAPAGFRQRPLLS